MAALYADENFPLPAVIALRELGHEVLTTDEAGKGSQSISDEDVLSFAFEQERILLTLNRKHFIRLHNENKGHAGIIVCTFDSDFAALARRIHDAITAEGSLSGKLVRVNRPGTPA